MDTPSDELIRELLIRHWQMAGTDEGAAHEIHAEDAVLEFPQSGERFSGRANFQVWREKYPHALEFDTRRIWGTGDLWVVENVVAYDEDDI